MRPIWVFVLISVTVLIVVGYLMYINDEATRNHTDYTIEMLSNASETFREIVSRKEKEKKLDERRKEVADKLDEIKAQFDTLVDDNVKLRAYISELEDAIRYTTEWMDELLEVLNEGLD